jgi:hypothetical protein
MRIKKKDAVVPFRDTLAYRLLLSTVSVAVLIFTLYQFISGVRRRDMTLMIVAGGASAMAVTSLFYNLGQVRNARVPERPLRRAGRR